MVKDFRKLFTPGDKILVIPDTHLGKPGNTAWPQLKLAAKAGQALGCKKLIQLGDLLDLHLVSPHKGAYDAHETWEDINAAHGRFCDIFEGSKLKLSLRLDGNHDSRDSWFKETGFARYGSLEHFVPSLNRWGATCPNGSYAHVTDQLMLHHGDGLPGVDAKYSAQAFLASNPGINCVYGHTHRLQAAYSTTTHPLKGKSTHMAVTLGHMTSDAFDVGNRKLRKFSNVHTHACGIINVLPKGQFTFDIGVFANDGKQLFIAGRVF